MLALQVQAYRVDLFGVDLLHDQIAETENGVRLTYSRLNSLVAACALAGRLRSVAFLLRPLRGRRLDPARVAAGDR